MRFFTASRLNKMKNCFRNGDYDKALVLADKISPAEIRTAYDLSMMADIYMAAKRYGAARRVFAEMYKRNKTVRVCKQLIALNIKLKSVKQAIIYLKELGELDNEDYERFIFQYQIGKMLGQPDEYLIECLKKVREADYIDKWALELAKLFYKAGRTNECIKECQNIKLWFPDTEFSYGAELLLGACRAGVSYEDTVENYKYETVSKLADDEEFEEDYSDNYEEDAAYNEAGSYDENSYDDEDDEIEDYELELDSLEENNNEEFVNDEAESGELESYSESLERKQDDFDLGFIEDAKTEDDFEDESIALLERSVEGKAYGSGTFDDRSYARRKYDSAAMTEISADDEAEISAAVSDSQIIEDEFEADILPGLSDSVMTIMDEDSEKNSPVPENKKADIATTLVNDSLTNEVINALFAQEKNGYVGERDAVDESILKMLEEE